MGLNGFLLKNYVFFLVLSLVFGGISLEFFYTVKPFMWFIPISCFLLKAHATRYRIKPFEVCFLFFAVFASMSYFWSFNPHASLKMIIGLLVFCVLYVMNRSVILNIEMKDIVTSIINAGLVFCSISVVLYCYTLYQFGGDYSTMPYGNYLGLLMDRGVPRMTGTIRDPNLFAMTNMFFLFFSFVFFQRNLAKVLLLISILVLILTFSRGGYVAAFLGFFTVALVRFGLTCKVSFNKNYLLVLVCSLFVVFLFYNLIPDAYVKEQQLFLARFTSISVASGRVELWLNGFSLIKESPLLGFGVFTGKHLNVEYFSVHKYFHNSYLELLIEVGLIGFLLYLLFNFTAFFSVFKKRSALVNESDNFFVALVATHVSLLVSIASLTAYMNEMFLLVFSLYLVMVYSVDKVGYHKETHNVK
ncbi:O-antigen ligase family protein [Vibrio scophthalmi]|uniref:O-antigen ligase-related domain-containing protein n=1 Tax=Vibrio scophthalmi TaxID=45658 RepID=A0A1E3WJI4_9VIBR|nr:O-antigen ligase family protein [Vibrio scophthalmi]ODS09933.1 hypothetical protein VSF3289_00171 [Vibrio scophthalmi]